MDRAKPAGESGVVRGDASTIRPHARRSAGEHDPAIDRVRVLVAGPGRSLVGVMSALPAVAAEWESDVERAIQLFLLGVLDVGVVEAGQVGGVSGAELIREAVARGCPVPLILVTNARADGAQEEAALAAGAVACVDLARARPEDLGARIAFAHANRLQHDQRDMKLVEGVSAFLGDHCKEIVSDIDRALEALARSFPAESADRTICHEIQARLRSFRSTVDAVTLAVGLRVPLAEARATFAAAPASPPAAAARRSPARRVRPPLARGADGA